MDVAERAHLGEAASRPATVLTMVGDADPDEIRATYEAEGNPYFSTARPGTTASSIRSTRVACSRSG